LETTNVPQVVCASRHKSSLWNSEGSIRFLDR
jgi:hypothetical protein